MLKCLGRFLVDMEGLRVWVQDEGFMFRFTCVNLCEEEEEGGLKEARGGERRRESLPKEELARRSCPILPSHRSVYRRGLVRFL